MKNGLAAAIIFVSITGWAASPSENLIESCLQAHSTAPSITIHDIAQDTVLQEDNYAPGFNATYIFKYKGADVGYANGKRDQALIYSGKLYPLSKSIPLDNGKPVKYSEFNPALAQWSLAKEGRQRYLCVGFNFDGLGQSGSFQNVYGGYLLNLNNKNLYFAVRDVRR
nr:hypothetical protein HUO10_004660 [Paraburkholderia busanensis]